MTHGTTTGYTKGCRCADCKSAKAEYGKRRATERAEAFGLTDLQCANCGSTEDIQFDHIKPIRKQSKRLKVSQLLWNGTDEALTAELAKCQPLCGYCHRLKVSTYLYDGELVDVMDTASRLTPREEMARRKGVWTGWYIRDVWYEALAHIRALTAAA